MFSVGFGATRHDKDVPKATAFADALLDFALCQSL
jgi:hypothetical protein